MKPPENNVSLPLHESTSRRTALKLLAASAALGPSALSAGNADLVLPHRVLGRTGQPVSLITLGGAHMSLDPTMSDEYAITLMRTAIDEGITFFDNAWNYGQGVSEERMGKALGEGYRRRVLLMTKERSRDARVAIQRLEQSLSRLRVDMIDLWQFHGIERPDDPTVIYEQGLLEAAERARDQGKIRYIGFTGHRQPDLHVEMIERGFPWDATQMPVNIVDPHYLSFIEHVLPLAIDKNIGVIAMKTLAGTPGNLVGHDAVSVDECLRYVMSLPVSTVCSGMDTLEMLRYNIRVARRFEPLTDMEIEKLLKRTVALGKGGKLEGYKVRT